MNLVKPCQSLIIFYSHHVLSSHRAFRINELKTEVTNRLAMLEKRVECKWCIYSSNEKDPPRKSLSGATQTEM